MELEKELARGSQQDRKMLIEESFMHANSRKPVRVSIPCTLAFSGWRFVGGEERHADDPQQCTHVVD